MNTDKTPGSPARKRVRRGNVEDAEQMRQELMQAAVEIREKLSKDDLPKTYLDLLDISYNPMLLISCLEYKKRYSGLSPKVLCLILLVLFY